MLTQRQRGMLARFAEHGEFLTVTDLASQFGVTPRSIRYDLQTIEVYLSGTPWRMERHHERGVRVWIAPEQREPCLARWRPDGSATYRLSPVERRQAIVAALLRRNTLLSLGRLSDELFVSRRTLVQDLKAAETWLLERGLLLRRHGRGVSVTGEEGAWRKAMIDLVRPGLPHTLLQPLGPDEMQVIRMAVEQASQRLPFELADVASQALVFHLAVAVMRLRDQRDIVMDPSDLAELERTAEWAVVGSLVADLQERLGMRFPRDEWGYLTLHLLGAKAIRARSVSAPPPGADGLEAAIANFIRTVGAHLGVNLTDDADLHSGLTLHLRPALYRLRYGLGLENPLKRDIQERYGYLLNAVVEGALALETELHVRLNEDELCYLALHIGASLERSCSPVRTRVLLVCSSGIGTARLLQSRICRAFRDVDIVDAVPMGNAGAFAAANSVDVIVSTVPMPAGPIPVVVVNPFLTPEDVRQVGQVLTARYRAMPHERMGGPMLADVLGSGQIQLDVEVVDWEEAIRTAGQPLVSGGNVESRFIDAMIETVHRIGAYIVLDPGVAMPHARPEDGVRRIGFSFARLKTPVNFGHPTNDPVRLVICIASPDGGTHLQALQQMAELLGDPERRSVLEHGSVDDILAMVHDMERR